MTQIDLAVALAMALATARQHGPEDVSAAPIMFWLRGVEEENDEYERKDGWIGVPR